MKVSMIVLVISVSLFSTAHAEYKNYGVGLGIPYGLGAGINFDYSWRENIDITLALGTSIFAGPAFGMGVKYYRGKYYRFSLYYGTNGAIEATNSFGRSFTETYDGITAGLGRIFDNGLELDFLFILTGDQSSRINLLKNNSHTINKKTSSDVSFSIGYRF